jgi:RNA polymerase-binding protein DksA
LSAIDTERFRTTLLEERGRVVAAIAYLHEENPGSLEDETGELVSGSADNHMADTATETYDRELDYTLEENSEQVLAEIDAALARIDAGTYGVCERCGRPIAEERLEALPWATLCIDDQRRKERR